MIKLGITGGIGSGKSTVSTLFNLYGIPVYNADKEAKILNDTSPIIKEALKKHFGEDLYCNNVLDKKKLANIIFNDSNKLNLVNSIIHPEVLKHFINWCEQHTNYPIVALEAAVLFEANFQKHLDKTITVYSPRNLRVSRVSERDNTTIELVNKRMEHQMPESNKIELADYVIINDNKKPLIKQVEKLIEEIKSATNTDTITNKLTS